MKASVIAALFMSAALMTGACSNDRKAAQQQATTSAEEVTQAAPAAGSPATSQQASTISPEELGELGAQIEKQPDKAQELLTARGLDEKKFEQEIRKVTENPEASKRYAEAYKKAKA